MSRLDWTCWLLPFAAGGATVAVLSKLRAIAECGGPWGAGAVVRRPGPEPDYEWPCISVGAAEGDGGANAEFIAASRSAVPALVAEVRRLRAAQP